MRPLTWYCRPVELREQPPVIDGADHSRTVLDISSDLETSEPIFDLRRGRDCVSDLRLLSPPNGSAENLAYQSLVQGYISYDEFMQLVSHRTYPRQNSSDRPTVEARKLEHYSPHALNLKYKGVLAVLALILLNPCSNFLASTVFSILRFSDTEHSLQAHACTVVRRLLCPISTLTHGLRAYCAVLGGNKRHIVVFVYCDQSQLPVRHDGVRSDALELTLPCVTFQSRR